MIPFDLTLEEYGALVKIANKIVKWEADRRLGQPHYGHDDEDFSEEPTEDEVSPPEEWQDEDEETIFLDDEDS